MLEHYGTTLAANIEHIMYQRVMELNAITLVSIMEHMKKQRIICNCRLSRESVCEINATADIIADLLAALHKTWKTQASASRHHSYAIRVLDKSNGFTRQFPKQLQDVMQRMRC